MKDLRLSALFEAGLKGVLPSLGDTLDRELARWPEQECCAAAYVSDDVPPPGDCFRCAILRVWRLALNAAKQQEEVLEKIEGRLRQSERARKRQPKITMWEGALAHLAAEHAKRKKDITLAKLKPALAFLQRSVPFDTDMGRVDGFQEAVDKTLKVLSDGKEYVVDRNALQNALQGRRKRLKEDPVMKIAALRRRLGL